MGGNTAIPQYMKNKPTRKRNTKATGGTIQQVLPLCFAILFLVTSRLSIARYKISYVLALTMLTAGNKEPHRLFCFSDLHKHKVECTTNSADQR